MTGNTITGNEDQFPFRIRDARLRPSNLTGNTITGNRMNVIAVSGTLVENWTVPSTGPMIVIDDRNEWDGGTVIAADATMTVPAGVVIKVANNYKNWENYSAGILVNGHLITKGTAEHPVVFTALTDDAYGGDTNGDADDSAPYIGEWNGITVSGDTASAELQNVVIRYATTAVSADGGAAVTVSGALPDNTTAVWSDGTFVDARNIDWGSAAGPPADQVQGSGVIVTPWVGWVAPPRPAVATPQPVPTTNHKNCKPYTVFGLRGSQEFPQGSYSLLTGWSMPPFGDDEDYGFGDKTTMIYEALTQLKAGEMKQVAIKYKALPVPIVNPFVAPGPYMDSVYQGTDMLIARMAKEAIDCPASVFVVVGYSQGALSAHIAFRQMATSNPSLLAKVAGVAFVADPGRVVGGAESWWMGASVSNDGTVSTTPPSSRQKASGGVWSAAVLFAGNNYGPMPNIRRREERCPLPSVRPGLLAYVGNAISFGQHSSYDENE